MALYRKNCMTLFVDINVIATYDINDINLEVDINVSLPLGTMLALRHTEGFLVQSIEFAVRLASAHS